MANVRITEIATEVTLPGELSADVLELDSTVEGTRKIALSNLLNIIGGETSSGAQSKANAAQAYAIQRSNHTGTQAISTVTGLQTSLDRLPGTVTISSLSPSGGTDGDIWLKYTP
jgi:hypothetical protein